MIEGIQIDLISEERLSLLTSVEKVRLILDQVRKGTIVILERGLSPEEQSTLIEMAMLEILPDGFNGLEIESYPSRDEGTGIFSKLVGKSGTKPRMTVIGPANQLKMIKKERDLISAWVSSR